MTENTGPFGARDPNFRALARNTEREREMALRYLARNGATDLADMLGLARDVDA